MNTFFLVSIILLICMFYNANNKKITENFTTGRGPQSGYLTSDVWKHIHYPYVPNYWPVNSYYIGKYPYYISKFNRLFYSPVKPNYYVYRHGYWW